LKTIAAFLRLVRAPNLVFIVVTQVLFYYCILNPTIGINLKLNLTVFWMLVLSSVLIAAAGYIINDYFDLNIDQVNKPDSIVVQRYISRRWAIFWHFIFSSIGIVLAFYVSWELRNPIIGFANFGCVILLWLYSTTFKKQLLIGNILISLLTAWVIFVLYFAEMRISRFDDPDYIIAFKNVFKYTVLYSGFAFMISLIREVVKDMEDREGDERYGCKTMPIVWGLQSSKLFVGIWTVVLMASLLIIQVIGLFKGWWLGVLFTLLTVILPLLRFLIELKKAQTAAAFHRLSTLIKAIMLAGILTLLFFKWYL
jgi:4-hydroxybenzoate polyprenyltransferase